MKTPKLIKKASKLLDSDTEKRKCLKEILAKLKKKQRALQEKLKKEKDKKERDNIQNDLAILFAQRKKGVQSIKAIKLNERKGKTGSNNK